MFEWGTGNSVIRDHVSLWEEWLWLEENEPPDEGEIEIETVHPGRQMTIILVNPAQHEIQLSPHFRSGEFASKGGTAEILIHKDLLEGLQRMREEIGKPMRITSAFRPWEYNRLVGGAKWSRHLYGRAADVVVDGMSGHQIADVARRIGRFKGIGISWRFCHVDVRDVAAEWRY